MASTIKLKTSTSSGNVPSSLSKGEVAINVADGVWYYGGASAVQQNFTFGSVTVTGDTSLDGKLVVTGNTVMNGTLSASSVNVGNGAGSVSAATITASGEIDGGSLDIEGDADINGTTNLDAVDIDGNVQLDGTLTVGVNDTGYDVKFFGASDGKYLHWDEDEDELILGSSTQLSFHDSKGDENIVASSDGHLEINAGTTLDITTPTVMTSAKLRVGSDLIVTGNTVMNGTLSASSVNIGNGTGSVSAATITASGEIDGGSLDIEGDADINGTTHLDDVDVDGDITMANNKQLFLGSANASDPAITFLNDPTTGMRLPLSGSMRFVVEGTDIISFNQTTFFPVADSSVSLGLNGYRWSTVYADAVTVTDDVTVGGNISVDGTANLDDTDIDGTLVVDGSNISLDSTSTLNIDNSNTSNGITIGTATSGVPIQLGHSTSNVRINDNLVVTGNTVMNGTLSATTSLNVGNGNGTISAATINGVTITGTIGSDASPVTAYINNGEIDGTTLGGESAVSIAGANYLDIANSEADNVALSVIGHSSQTASILEVKDGGEEGTLWFGVAANGRSTINSAVIGGGTINAASIGATTRNTGAFTTLISQLGLTSQSTLVVTGNTTLNGTLSATTSAKVGNGDGLISGATLHAGNVLKSDGTLVVTGNTVLNGTLSATTSAKIGNGDGLVSAATVTAAGSVTLPDNGKVKLGNAGDLEIYHNGSNSFIDDTGTGTLFYRSGTQTFQNAAGSKTMAVFNAASTVDLSFNDSVKLSTNTSGVHIDGTVSANTAVYAGTGVDDGVISANTVNGAYQFISFVGNSGSLTTDNWQYPGTNGISNHTWGYAADGSGISTGSSTISISRTKQMSGIILPAGTRIVGITGAIRSSVDDTGYAGLFTYSPDYGGPDTVNATLRILAQSVDDSGGASVLNDPQFFKGDAAFASQYVVQEGDQILPAWRRGPGGSTQTIVGTFTIIVKY